MPFGLISSLILRGARNSEPLRAREVVPHLVALTGLLAFAIGTDLIVFQVLPFLILPEHASAAQALSDLASPPSFVPLAAFVAAYPGQECVSTPTDLGSSLRYGGCRASAVASVGAI